MLKLKIFNIINHINKTKYDISFKNISIHFNTIQLFSGNLEYKFSNLISIEK